MFVSYTNVFDMALQGRDQFHPPGTVFMHDYVGFCAQPVWPALGKKSNIYDMTLTTLSNNTDSNTTNYNSTNNNNN